MMIMMMIAQIVVVQECPGIKWLHTGIKWLRDLSNQVFYSTD
jgi:hypothetical protein